MKILREAMVLPTKYFFSSFHPEILGRAQQCAPNIGRLMLIDPRLTSGEKTRLVEHLKGKGLEFQGVGLGDYVPEHPDWIDESKRITPRLVKHFKEQGLMVGAYVINELSRAEELKEMGVDGIVTDRIDRVNNSLVST